jgi:hypothetical protein
MMVYDASQYNRAHKKLLSKWFGPYQIMQVYKSNGTYTLREVTNCIKGKLRTLKFWTP